MLKYLILQPIYNYTYNIVTFIDFNTETRVKQYKQESDATQRVRCITYWFSNFVHFLVRMQCAHAAQHFVAFLAHVGHQRSAWRTVLSTLMAVQLSTTRIFCLCYNNNVKNERYTYVLQLTTYTIINMVFIQAGETDEPRIKYD